jgi:hypothetical protein
MNVTGEEVRQAMATANINAVDLRKCSLCGYQLQYLRDSDGALFFDPGCDCGSWNPPEPRSYEDIARLINMQSSEDVRAKLRTQFGLPSQATGGAK